MGVMDLRRDILLNEPHIASAVGNPVAFSTDVKGFLQQVKVGFSPMQTGTGDPSPSNVRPIVGTSGVNVWRTGKNLACVSSYVTEQDRSSNGITYHAVNNSMVHVKGLATGNSYMIPSGQSANTALKAGKYTISSNLPNDNGSRVYITSATESISYHAVYDGHSVTKTISSDLDDVQVQIYIGSGTDIDMDVWVQIELGESATTYSPYTGQSYSVVFPALGKNLLPYPYKDSSISNNGITGQANANGTVSLSGEATANTFFNLEQNKVLKAGTYTISKSNVSGVRICVAYSSGGTLIAYGETSSATFTLDEDATVNVYIRIANGTNISSGITVSPMLETGSTAHDFEPYTNTCYGGKFNVANGTLLVEKVSDTVVWGNGNASADLTSVTRRWFYLTHGVVEAATSDGKYCNKATFRNDYSYNGVHFYTSVTSGTSRVYLFMPIGTEDTETLQVVYPLAEPYTIQLSPTQITALLGNNTIWSDANGDATIKFWSH